MYRKFVAAGMLVFAMAGCASTAQSPESGRAVSAELVFDKTMLDAAVGKGVVTVARDSFFVASRTNVEFYADGAKVAEIPNGQVLRVSLPAGAHRIGVKQSDSKGSPVKYEELVITAGGKYDYRLMLNGEKFELIKLY